MHDHATIVLETDLELLACLDSFNSLGLLQQQVAEVVFHLTVVGGLLQLRVDGVDMADQSQNVLVLVEIVPAGGVVLELEGKFGLFGVDALLNGLLITVLVGVVGLLAEVAVAVPSEGNFHGPVLPGRLHLAVLLFGLEAAGLVSQALIVGVVGPNLPILVAALIPAAFTVVIVAISLMAGALGKPLLTARVVRALTRVILVGLSLGRHLGSLHPASPLVILIGVEPVSVVAA